MSIRTSLLIFLLLGCSYLSCKRNCSDEDIQRLMGNKYKTTLHFPQNLELVNRKVLDSSAFNQIILAKSQFYVIHFFSADCEECVNNLITAQKFMEQNSDVCNVEYIFIAGGPSKHHVQGAMDKVEFKQPIYFERDFFSFKKLNSFPIEDALYNTILINKSGEILLFGGIFNNEKASNLFKQTVQCAPCNQ